MVKNNKKGLSLIILVFMILITTSIIVAAYAFLIIHEMRGSGIELNEQKALYIAETGIERAMEYLEDDTDWSDNNGASVISEDFGAGSFDLDLSSGTRTTIVVTSLATVDSGPRQLTRKIRQKIRRLPEAFNYAVFSNSTNSLQVQGTVEINGGDLYAKGNITGGTLNVSDGGTVSASRGGLVYSEGSSSATGTYSVGTTPDHSPSIPSLDTTYYDDIMSGYDSDISTYDTSASYLGYSGSWTLDPNGTVNITLSGNILYYSNFKAKNNSTITGNGAIVSDNELKLENTTSVTPSGGTILLISREKTEIKNTSSVGANTIFYSKNDELKVKDSASVTDSTLLSADKVKIEGGTVTNSTLYVDASADKIEIKDSSTTVSNSTLLAQDKIEVKEEATVSSDSVAYIPSSGDKIEVKNDNTSFDGSILSNNKFKIDKGAVTGIIFASESELKEGTINGSLVTDTFKDNKIGTGGKTVTINYDHIDYSYFPAAPAGLGRDIDGDVNEEGIITKVPGTWQQL